MVGQQGQAAAEQRHVRIRLRARLPDLDRRHRGGAAAAAQAGTGVAITAPVVVVLLSTRRRACGEASSGNSRCPDPSGRGWVSKMYWAIRLLRLSGRTSPPLARVTRAL